MAKQTSFSVFSLLNALKEHVPLGRRDAPQGQSTNWSVCGIGSVLYLYAPVKTDKVFIKDQPVNKDSFIACLNQFGLQASYDSKEGGILVSGDDAAKVLKAGGPDQSATVSKLAAAIASLQKKSGSSATAN